MTTSASKLTPSRGIPDTVSALRTTYRSGRTRPVEWRLEQLAAVQRMMTEREAEFIAALRMDLGRPAVEGWLADLAPVTAEARHAAKHLRTWMRPTKVPVPLAIQPGKAFYRYEPLGTVLVIGPWNYPIHLTLLPMVAALAAGNCVVLKPSEQTPACAKALARIVPQYLDPEAVAVVQGAVAETEELIDQAFDHCFFTGSPEVGKKIMAAAAKHLTPVTLELGGKSPVIVADDARINVAAKRIAFAKLLNSGQTCVAPDYVLVDRKVREPFVAALTKAIDAFSTDATLPLINPRQAARIDGLVADAGGDTVRGGSVQVDAHRAELTVIVDPDAESALMRDEIFGPVLPIVTVDSVDDAIAHVLQGPKPLAVYLFSENRANEQRVLDEISNGGTVINHLVFHLLVPELPFGGVGNSGTGAYHGSWGFQTFSHRKAVLRKPTRPDPALSYPPYTWIKERIMRKVFDVRLVVTRDDYFAAAMDVLATSGHGALKIGPLCRAIGVTTGSFYHYFGSWDAFVDHLLGYWEREKTQRLADLASAETDPIARVRTIKKLALGLPHDAETAIRAWGHVNPAVAAVQARVDQERLESLRAAISPLVGRNRRSERLAVMGVTLLVGQQQWRSPVDVRELARLLDDYEGLILSYATAVAS